MLIKSAINSSAWHRLIEGAILIPPALVVVDNLRCNMDKVSGPGNTEKGEGKLSPIKVKVSAETCQKK